MRQRAPDGWPVAPPHSQRSQRGVGKVKGHSRNCIWPEPALVIVTSSTRGSAYLGSGRRRRRGFGAEFSTGGA